MALTVEELMGRLVELSGNGTFAGLDEPALAGLITEELTPAAHLYLQIFNAQRFSHLDEGARALDLLGQLGAKLAELECPSREMGLLEGSLASFSGLALSTVGRNEEALVELRIALERYSEAGLQWQCSGVLINTAIATSVGDPHAALDLLDLAAERALLADVPENWKLARKAAIRVNRSGFLAIAGEREEAIAELIAARPELIATGDPFTLARVDFSLAGIYAHMGRYGSSLEAAEAALSGYATEGAEELCDQARLAIAKAQTKLGRYGEAELLARALIARHAHQREPPDSAIFEAGLELLGSIFRATNRLKEADKLEHIRLEVVRPDENEPAELRALKVVMDAILGAINDITAGKEPVRPAIVDTALADLAASSNPRARQFLGLIEGLWAAVESGQTPPPLDVQALEALRLSGSDPGDWEDLIELAVGLRLGDQERTLRGNLGDLVRFQIQASTQEGSAYRAPLLATRGGSSFDICLAILLERGNHAAVFELIEWCRRDFGDPGRAESPEDLAPYATLAREEPTPSVLPAPATLSVDGASELRRAVPELPIAADAPQLLGQLAGPGAAWWTLMIRGGALVWALMADGLLSAGQISLDTDVRAALERHFAALPLANRSDLELLDPSSPPWCLEVLAIARAAAGPLLEDPELCAQCLAALPGDVAERFSARGESGDADRAGAALAPYQRLGELIVPPQLSEFLEARGAEARLLVSVQPELATIPTCLLGSGDGRPLLERAAISYAPPTRIAVRVAGRAPTRGPARASLAVIDPTGDLTAVALPGYSSFLSGWAEAASDSRSVATPGNLRRATRDLGAAGAPSALSYVGHIRAATEEDPEGAALVLAGESPTDGEAYLGAAALAVEDLPMPDRLYLGGCEGAGFGGSLEWSSVAAAALDRGASTVIAHRWPIVNAPAASVVDLACSEAIRSGADVASLLSALQRRWYRDWKAGVPGSVAAHYWAGLQVIGRSVAEHS